VRLPKAKEFLAWCALLQSQHLEEAEVSKSSLGCIVKPCLKNNSEGRKEGREGEKENSSNKKSHTYTTKQDSKY
jgi:hypothetical protein